MKRRLLICCYALLSISLQLVDSNSDPVWYSRFVVVRGQAELPCQVPETILDKDRPELVLWYKQDQPQVPIYSYDTSNGPFSEGVRWADKTYLGNRSFFRINGDPPTLAIKDVKISDQDVYTCRVEFKYRPYAATKVNLTVIVPAGPPLVLDSMGNELRGVIGPLEEGEKTHLTCRGVGGTPEPTLSWWKDGHKTSQQSIIDYSGEIVESRISVTATRELQDATLSCQALNNNITEPSTTSLTVSVLLRPISVEIIHQKRHLSAGKEIELVCEARGSRPAAKLTWWRGHKILENVKHTVMNNGNLTTGSIKYVPRIEDDGRNFSCKAVNPEISHIPLQTSIALKVLYKPKLSLRYGSALLPDDIKEGDDVYFECSVRANPPSTGTIWFHNGEPLNPRDILGVIISDKNLVMQRVGRQRAGNYHCSAQNSEGEGISNTVSLNVMYKPVCAHPAKKSQNVTRQETAKVICKVDAYPPEVNFTWKFNGSSEGEVLPVDSIENHGTISALNYTAAMEQDFGTLLCWATNRIGRQRKPCVIHLVPKSLSQNFPEAPINCSVVNQSSVSIRVECIPPVPPDTELYEELYLMEAWGQDRLLQNTSSVTPVWDVKGLHSGMGVRLIIWAASRRGNSQRVILEADIMKVAEKRMGPPEEINVPPVIGAVVGGVGALLVLTILAIIMSKYARRCGKSSKSRSNETDRISNSSEDLQQDSTPLTNLSAVMMSKDASVTSCATIDHEDLDVSSSRHQCKSGSMNTQLRNRDTKASLLQARNGNDNAEAHIKQSFGERKRQVISPINNHNIVNNLDLVRGTTDCSHGIAQSGGMPAFALTRGSETFAILQGQRTASPVSLKASMENSERETHKGLPPYSNAMEDDSRQYLDHIIYRTSSYQKQQATPLNSSQANRSSLHQSNPSLYIPQQDFSSGSEKSTRDFPSSGITPPGIFPCYNNSSPQDQLSSGKSRAGIILDSDKILQRQHSIDITIPFYSKLNCGPTKYFHPQQHYMNQIASASTSSLHDLNAVEQQSRHNAQINLHIYNQKDSHEAKCNTGCTSRKGVVNKNNSNIVTHFATLGRKPILKNSIRDPLSVKSGVGDFLSGKHQESAV